MEYLSAISPVISIINGLVNVVNNIKSQDSKLEKLNFTIMEAWEVLDLVFHHQLRSNDPIAFEKEAKILTKWCYDAEDFWDKKNLEDDELIKKTAKSMIISDRTGELEKGFNEILTQYNRISTNKIFQTTATHQCNGNHGSHWSSSDLFILRDNDVGQVVHKLLSRDSTNGISILGMCGLGKSSLVHTILNRDDIVKNFPCRSWVDVRNGNFFWNDAKELIDASTRNKHYKNLLIVFDNLLSVTHTEWHKFWLYKKEQENNSICVKFIITTHNLRIPERTVTASHYLKPLLADCCEEVIKEIARLYGKELSKARSSQIIVKSVARRCEGLPLVAKLLGIVLAKCNDDDRMEAIGEEGSLWQMPEFRSEILPRLSPSYEGIRSELRRCLAYFSLFPHDHHFNTDDLVHLFVGECFLQSSEATSSLKKIGEKCVHELKERSILQPFGTSYKLHSFGQYFAMLAASGTCQHLHQDVSSLSSLDKKVRHLSLSGKCNSQIWSQISKSSHPKLRTYLSLFTRYNHGRLGENPPQPKESLSHLRVLALTGTDVEDLSTFIYKLKYLRYLDISFTNVSCLPQKLHKQNIFLQFLKIKETNNLLTFPGEFHKLTNLRYVDWDVNLMRKKEMPCQIGGLSRLESLPLFQIGRGNGYSIKELKNMNNLQGSIHIENLNPELVSTEEAKEAMLQDKCDLKSIVLEWTKQSARDIDILTALRPHKNLKELKMIKYGGDDLPEWISNSMIEKVSLIRCHSCYLPALGKMENLKTLVLGYMGCATLSCRSEDDTDGDVRFRSLESMKFHNMTALNDWTGLEAHVDLPELKELTFDECPRIEDSLPFIGHLRQLKPDIVIDIYQMTVSA